MGLSVRWGLGAGVVIALVDFLAVETTRGVSDTDLAAAIVLVDLLVNLVLCGWAGYRVAGALGEMRAGLEAAVLAGLVAGLAGTAYHVVRATEATSTVDSVFLVAFNVVLAAGAGALGAWTGSSARREIPPGGRRGPHP
jgi:hypothetical protein